MLATVDDSSCGLRTGPPLSNPAWKETERASHEDCKVASKAMVGRKGMYLCTRVSRGRDFKAFTEAVQRTSSPLVGRTSLSRCSMGSLSGLWICSTSPLKRWLSSMLLLGKGSMVKGAIAGTNKLLMRNEIDKR